MSIYHIFLNKPSIRLVTPICGFITANSNEPNLHHQIVFHTLDSNAWMGARAVGRSF